jgi:hypothetical protein
MAIVTATQVRAVGGWESSEYSDAVLNATPFIPIGDSWLNQVCVANGYSTGYTGVTDTYKQGLLIGAECYYVARQLVLTPQREDFKTGPVESKDVKNSERVELAGYYWDLVKDYISRAGFTLRKFGFAHKGGYQYHPSGTDNTNIDFRYTSSDKAFDVLGGDEA